nr:MAG: terminase [Bacteriophage sp.]UVX59256.1 MAG: Terminase [Bacteriophage sp.]UWD64974.1 MAG: Terminase [Bacteriophage sp.]UWD75881.1 MAG: Terminase [Bacteriophage sp.]
MADGKYPFLEYIEEPDKEKKYKKASDCGWYDPHNNFLIGDSGGFLLNIRPGKFVNTELFNEAARTYQATGKYTQFKVDSIPHRQFRRRECDRRRNGFSAPCWQNPDGSIEDVWITGGHYNFLNYTRMERTDESSVIVTEHGATAKKIYSFPSFIDAQFWTWQIIEFCRRNGLHLIIDKTRRGGFSYIMAADSSNEVNLSKHKVVIHVAADNKYLIKQGGLSDFAVNNLKFFEEKTPFKRGIYSPTTDSFKLGYRMKNGVEADDSWSSSLLSVSANNNPDCAIGKDAVTIKVEELSTMQNFDDFMNVTEPTMTVGTRTTGTLMAWGTATAANMQIFEQNFYNPRAFRFMAFENVWDNDARNEVCGFFKSYAWGLEGEIDGVKGFDKDGNSNLRIGLQLAARERIEKKKTAKTFAEYLNYLGQRALFPAESFSSASENIFSSEALNKFEDKLRVDNSYKFYTDGELFEDGTKKIYFKSNARIRIENPDMKTYDYIQGVPRRGNEDPHGCIRVWFAPEYEETYINDRLVRSILPGTYVAVYDPVGIDKDKKEITDRHSHNSIFVIEMPRERNGFKPKLCAAYYGRTERLEEADEKFYRLCKWYNCIGTGLVEINRGETVSNFRKWKATKYLGYEPLYVWDSAVKEKVSTSYGYNIGSGPKKLDGLRLLKEFLYEVIGKNEFGEDIYVFERFLDYQTILELKKFNAEGNFDRISSLILLGIYWKSIDIKGKRELASRKKVTEENDKTDIFNRQWF